MQPIIGHVPAPCSKYIVKLIRPDDGKGKTMFNNVYAYTKISGLISHHAPYGNMPKHILIRQLLSRPMITCVQERTNITASTHRIFPAICIQPVRRNKYPKIETLSDHMHAKTPEISVFIIGPVGLQKRQLPLDGHGHGGFPDGTALPMDKPLPHIHDEISCHQLFYQAYVA
jgi:hypothetical protein